MRTALIVILATACVGRVLAVPAEVPCETVPLWQEGRQVDAVCLAGAPAELAIISLDDTWAPAAFAAAPAGGAPAYRDTYVALAAERYGDAGGDGALAAADRRLDPYGIQPSLTVLRARLEDDARHTCHELVDDDALANAPDIVPARNAADRRRARSAIAVLEAHLACETLLADRAVDGKYDRRTRAAVRAFQRGAMLVPTGTVDRETRDALAGDSRERDYATALRVLRERVIDATGLLEDGTAGSGPSQVLGRQLESASLVMARGHEPLADAAPDLVGVATETAARALGWTDAAAVRAFLARHGPGGPEPIAAVAVRMPPRPKYHDDSMRLEVVIDRGDVWYEATPRVRPIERRPALVVYARVDAARIALVRWPTTIGGWQAELTDDVEDGIAQRWKESPVGQFVWRDLYIGPTWLPPRTTPDRELVNRTAEGRYVLQREALGPSYRSAYGLAMMVHHRVDTELATTTFVDTEIRTHGTANLPSVHRGVSHGCHRLLGVHALRLAGFIVGHVSHVHRGEQPAWYRRTVRYHGTFQAAVDTRGFLIELTTPIPVEVLPGQIRSLSKAPAR